METFFLNGLLWLLGGAITVITWFVKGNIDEVKALKDQITGLHLYYVKKDDFREFKEELWRRLDKLDNFMKDRNAGT